MSREAHVRFCERLGHFFVPVDSTVDRDTAAAIGVPSGSVPEGQEFS